MRKYTKEDAQVEQMTLLDVAEMFANRIGTAVEDTVRRIVRDEIKTAKTASKRKDNAQSDA